MKKNLLLSFFLVFLSGFASCAPVMNSIGSISAPNLRETNIGLYTIVADTVWEGRIKITGDVYVKQGATLTIKPGTVIRFSRIEPRLEADGGRNMVSLDTPYFPGAEIIVRGRIIAVGTKDSPIIFTSSEPTPRAGAWGAINLLGSKDDVFKYCRISYATVGIQNHSSEAGVTKCILHDNGTALSFKKADFNGPCVMDIEDNTIIDNKTGIAAREARAMIAHNDISANDFYGILLYDGDDVTISYNDIRRNRDGVYLEEAGPLKLAWNNFKDNGRYNIALSADNRSGVDARDNWWGTADPLKIENKFYDKRKDGSLGLIEYEPFLKRKVADTVK